MPNDYMYCTVCGTKVGPKVSVCPKCWSDTFSNIPIRGKPAQHHGSLFQTLDDLGKGNPPKFF